MWFLKRNGWQQGPFSRAQLEQMIVAGDIRDGLVCTEGESSWVQIDQHPIFGVVLAGATASPGPFRASTGTVLSAETASIRASMTPPISAGPSGSLQSTPGPHIGATATQPGSSAKSNRQLAWLAGLVGALLTIGIIVGVIKVLFVGSAGELARLVPEDVTIYIEFPDIPKTLEALPKMGFIDESKVDLEEAYDVLAEGVQDSFRLDEDTARQLLDDVEAIAMAMRPSRRGKSERMVVLIELSNGSAMEALLDTRRFDDDGKIGASGVLYTVDSERFDVLEPRRGTEIRRQLARIAVTRNDPDVVLAWFPDRNLLVFGDLRMVEDMTDIMDKGADSLAETEGWAAASFDWGVHGIMYSDYSDDEDAVDFLRDHPVSSSVDVRDEGIVGIGKVGLLATDLEFLEGSNPLEFTLPRRLPASTLTYLAVARPPGISGNKLLRDLVREIAAQDTRVSREDLEGLLSTVSSTYGFRVEDLWDELGNELIVAVVVPETLRVDASRQEMALVMLARPADREPFEQLIKGLRDVGEGFTSPLIPFEVARSNRDSVTFRGKGVLPSINLSLVDDILLLAVGDEGAVLDAVDALEGKGDQLGDDEAHRRALAVLSSEPVAYAWADVSRVIRDEITGSAAAGVLDKWSSFPGISSRAFTLRGDDRMTIAASLQLVADGEHYHLESVTLNIFDEQSAMMAFVGDEFLSARWNIIKQEFQKRTTFGQRGSW